MSALLAAASVVGSAHAQAEAWMPGVDVGTRVLTGLGGVVSDRSGATTTAWVESAGGAEETATLRVRRAAPDGAPGPPQTVGQIPVDEAAALAVTRSGSTSVVVWPAPIEWSDEVEIKLVTVRPDGGLGPIRSVASVAALTNGSVQVDVDPDGNATVAWLEGDGADDRQVRVRMMPHAGSAPPAVTLASDEGWRAAPEVVAAPDGTASVGWIANREGDEAYDVRVARATSAGGVGTPQTVAAVAGNASDLSLSASAAGVVATWLGFGRFEFERPDLRGVRLSPSGQVLHALDVAGKATMPGLPHSSTIAPDGTVTVVWSGYRSDDDARGRVRQFGPNGNALPVRDLAGAHRLEALVQAVAAPDGAVFLAWVGLDRNEDDEATILARRISPSGEFGPVAEVGSAGSAPGDHADRTLAVASDGVGGATVGWYFGRAFPSRYKTATYDGTPPTVEATMPDVVGLGNPALFSAIAHDRFGIASYRWELGDGVQASDAATAHRYGRAGAYPVALTVVDRAGNAAVVQRTLTVIADPAGPPDALGPGPGPGPDARPGHPPAPAAKRAPAGLKLRTVTRKGTRLTVAGSVGRRAGGKISVSYSQRFGRKTQNVTRRTKITKGRFRVSFRLTGRLGRATTGTAALRVRYAGDADTAPGQARLTVKVRGLRGR